MATKSEKDRAKQIQDKCQNLLTSMLRDEDNKYCVDCDSKGPRWASWNLGVFLCIRCAGIHRNLGVHISRVKSVNLDSWTPEQVVSLQQMGNSRARAVYEALVPDGFRRPQTDSSLENFIRAKYEHKKYLAREWVPPPAPKVDWDKEIDEEMEKQKKKKKASSNMVGGLAALSSTATNVPKSTKVEVVPQLLPKPNAKVTSSPKSVRGIERPTSSNSADLLGLDTKVAESEDLFSGFVSAEPPKAEVKPIDNKTVTDTLKSEEENFFNQPAPTEKEKTKLTKDSILALYGAAPKPNSMFGAIGNNVSSIGNISNNPINSVGNPMNFGASFPQQNLQFQQQNTTGFNNLQNYSNGVVGQQFQQQQQQQFNQVNQFPGNVNPNQFNMNSNTGNQFQQFQNVPPQQQFHNFGAAGITSNNQFARNTSFQQQQQQQQQLQQQQLLQQQQMQFGQQSIQNGGGFPPANGVLQQNQNFVQNQNGSQPNPFFNPSLNVQFGQMGLTNTTQFRNVWE